MFVIIWSRSGILVPIFFALSAWLIGYAYDDTTMKNGSYMGFVFLSTALLTFVHAFLIKAAQSAPDENGFTDPDRPKKRHTFFFIPVFYWGIICTVFCITFFVTGGIGNARKRSQTHYSPVVNSDPENNEESDKRKEKRTINFLNPTSDTLYYYLSSPDGKEEKKKVYPNNYLGVEVDPGKYLIGSFDMDNKLYYAPTGDFKKDENKYERVEEKNGDVFYYRIIHPGFKEEDMYDEAWFVMNGEKQMALIDVSEICFRGRTEKDIKKINWSEQVKEIYDSKDLIEPMQLETRTESIPYRILDLGEDIPEKRVGDTEIYMLISYLPGKKLTDAFIEEKVIARAGE